MSFDLLTFFHISGPVHTWTVCLIRSFMIALKSKGHAVRLKLRLEAADQLIGMLFSAQYFLPPASGAQAASGDKYHSTESRLLSRAIIIL